MKDTHGTYETVNICMVSKIFSIFNFRPIRGMTAVVAGAGPAHAFYFATYEYTKEMMTQLSPQHNQINYSTCEYIPACRWIDLILVFFFRQYSYFSGNGDPHTRRHFQSHWSDKTTIANVRITIQIGDAVFTRRLQDGGYASVLSIIQYTADHESTISGDTFFNIRVLSKYGEYFEAPLLLLIYLLLCSIFLLFFTIFKKNISKIGNCNLQRKNSAKTLEKPIN